MTPHDCVILAIDPGESSGWSIWCRGKLLQSGQVRGVSLPFFGSVVDLALVATFVSNNDLPCVLVRERPFGGRMGGNTGGASRVWKAVWDATEGAVKSRSVTVYPSVWRSRVGVGGGRTPRDVVRIQEGVLARQVKRANNIVPQTCGADEAPAILIGKWASYAPELAAKLPKGRAKR